MMYPEPRGLPTAQPYHHLTYNLRWFSDNCRKKIHRTLCGIVNLYGFFWVVDRWHLLTISNHPLIATINGEPTSFGMLCVVAFYALFGSSGAAARKRSDERLQQPQKPPGAAEPGAKPYRDRQLSSTTVAQMKQ